MTDIDVSQYSGDETFYAVAENDAGWSSAPESADYTFNQAVISNVTTATDLSGNLPMLTLSANGVRDAVGDVTSVSFFRDTSGTGVYDPSTVVAIGSAGEMNGWSVEVDPRTLSGNETFFAIANDGTYSSVAEAVTVNPVVIGELSASNGNLYANGQSLTLTASRLMDWNVGESVLGVNFYPAASDGSFDSSLTPLGSGTVDDNGNWNLSLTPSGWTGAQTIYAVALDGTSDSNPVALTLDPHLAPTIDRVTASTDTTTGSHYITLTANGVGDGSAVASVTFYQEDVGIIGTVTDGTNGWCLSGIDTSGFTGSQQFFAFVTNDAGQTAYSPTITVDEITVASFTTDPGQYVAGKSLTLTASDILDWNADSPTQTITYYQDTTGSGDFADATELGTGTSYTFSGSDTTGWTDPQTFFVQVTDSDGGASAPLAITIYPDQAPTVDSLSAVSDTSGSPTTLDLTAKGLFDIDGEVQSVEFYATTNSSGPFDPNDSGTTDLGSADSSTNWTLSGVSGSGLASGAVTFFAIATDDNGATSDPVALRLNPITIDELMASLGEYAPGETLSLATGGINDWAGNTIQEVDFYRATDPDDPFNTDTAESLGAGTLQDGVWVEDVSTSGLTGDQTYFAVATDGTWTSQPVVVSVPQDQSPSIVSVTAVASSSETAGAITLVANGIASMNDGPVTVTFYKGSVHSWNIIGTDDGTNGFSIDTVPDAGATTYYAVMTDSHGVSSGAVAMSVHTTLEWDPHRTNSGTAGGPGIWTTDAAALDWFDPLTGQDEAWSNVAGNTAVFDGPASVIVATADVRVTEVDLASQGSEVACVPGPNGELFSFSNPGDDSDVRIVLPSDSNGNTVLIKQGTGTLNVDSVENLIGSLYLFVGAGAVNNNTAVSINPVVQVAAGVSDTPTAWSATFNGDGSILYVGPNAYVSNSENLLALDCSNESLDGTLDLSYCVNLLALDCSGNQLTSLNVNGLSALAYLDCYGNQLTSLDLSDATSLTDLDCSHNQLTSISVAALAGLEYVAFVDNSLDATSVDALYNACGASFYYGVFLSDGSNAIPTDASQASRDNLLADGWAIETTENLTRVYSGSALGFSWPVTFDGDGAIFLTAHSAYLSHPENLLTLDCSNQSLGGALDLSACVNLTALDCSGNDLTSLHMSNSTALTFLKCSGNQLSSLDLNELGALTHLDCSGNRLTLLDIVDATELTYLDCSGNQLTSLDISGNTALTMLSCYDNQLTSLDVSGLTALTGFFCSNNHLSSLDLSECIALEYVNCGVNQLTSLDVSGLTALEALVCWGNQITSLGLSDCTALVTLVCVSNQLTSLDWSELTTICDLECGGNQFTSLDLGGMTALVYLECSSNQLTSLNLNGLTALSHLDCGNNQLTSLTVTGLSGLDYADCTGNALDAASVDALLNSCDATTPWPGPCYVYGGTNAAPTATSSANLAAMLADGWMVWTN